MTQERRLRMTTMENKTTLEMSRLTKVRQTANKTIAACPACLEEGSDKEGTHLFIGNDGRYGCIKYQGEAGTDHRKRIFELAGSATPQATEHRPLPPPCDAKLAPRRTWVTLAEAKQALTKHMGTINGEWTYTEADGKPVVTIVRFEKPVIGSKPDKTPLPFYETPEGWINELPKGKQLPLLNLPTLTTAPRVYVVEGEKCVEAMTGLNLIATTSQGGSCNAAKSDWSTLAGKEVCILPDNDDSGRTYSETVKNTLINYGCKAVIVNLPDLEKLGDGADVWDWSFDRDTTPTEILTAQIEQEADKALKAFVAPVTMPEVMPAVEPTHVVTEAEQLQQQVKALQAQTRAINKQLKPLLPKPTPPVEPDKAEIKCTDWTTHGVTDYFNHNNDYAYNKKLGWLKWCGSRWEVVEEAQIGQEVLLWAEAQSHAAITDRNKDAEKFFIKLRNTGSQSFIQVLQKQAFVPVERFGDKPWILNCTNGMVDTRTGVIEPHARSYSLHQTTVPFNPAADMTVWKQFVADVFPDKDTQHYMQVLLGYAITGCLQEEMFAIMYGTGKNGKSTLCNIVAAIIGDYSGVMPTSELAIKKNPESNTFHLVACVGKRLLFANEPPEGMVLDDSAIKTLASKDDIKVCGKFKDPFETPPTWLLAMRCNNKPLIKAVDEGIWRRVTEIPFTVSFNKPDKTIDKRLINDHGEAVLRWLVEGAIEYFKIGGFPNCEQVQAAGRAYRKDQDSVEAWFDSEIVNDAKVAMQFVAINDAYTKWCLENDQYPSSSKRLRHALDRRGYRKEPDTRVVTYIGLRLKGAN